MYVDAVIWGIWIQIFLQWWKLGSQTLTGTGWASSWRLVGANPLCFLLRSFSLVQQVSSISYLNQIALEILFGMLQWPCRPMAQALLDTWRSTRIKARMPCGGAGRQHSTHGLRNSGRTKLNFLRTKCWILPTTSLWILKLKVKPLPCCKLLAHIFSFWGPGHSTGNCLVLHQLGGPRFFMFLPHAVSEGWERRCPSTCQVGQAAGGQTNIMPKIKIQSSMIFPSFYGASGSSKHHILHDILHPIGNSENWWWAV